MDAELILASDRADENRRSLAVEPAGRIAVVVVAIAPAHPVGSAPQARPAVSALARPIDALAQHRRHLDAYEQVRDLRPMKGTRIAVRV